MKKASLFTPALLALSINAISTANAYDYKNFYVFGDSLSDGGNKKAIKEKKGEKDDKDTGKYTTDGATSQLYAEYIAKQLTGILLRPSEDGGTNYAVGGATAADTKTQVYKYLEAHNYRANPNSTYIHWIGGNDLAAALMTGAAKSAETKDPQQGTKVAQEMTFSSAMEASSQINALVHAGAGLIIAPTVPDVGTTPRLLEFVLTQAATPKDYDTLSEEQKNAVKAKINGMLKSVHDGINSYDTPNDGVRNLVLQGTFKEIAKQSVSNVDSDGKTKSQNEIATEIEGNYQNLLAAYNQASQGGSNLTTLYNNTVDKEISKSHGNILRADINGLLHEVIANPMIYGIDNALGYACGQGVDANKCSKNDASFTKDKSFLFSDTFHPTPLGHKIIAQYIDSIYAAPSQVMALNQVNRAPVKSALSSLDGHLQQLRNGGNEQGKIGVFGGFTGSQNTTFTLGSDYQLIDNLLLGAMYSNYKDERSPVADFSYEGNGHVFAAYGLWNYYNNGWLSGDIHYSHINYDSLTRSIKLGEEPRIANHKETGSTAGKQWGARITAGWDIPVTNYLTTSPIIQYAWDKGEIDGYRESGNSSTSMHFGNQKYTSKVGTLGWRVDTKLGRFNPYAAIQFNHQFDDARYKLSGAINSTETSFVRESDKQSRNWRQYTVGVNANLINNIRGFASVTRNDGNAQDPNYNFSLGINASF
ncbi:outer membrane esterase [Xenorhabdus mauleonii]|uniref:Outer membrane esterase n=1 Tax=Xenorhabdus mauleonii TaxID=351675 RepID=A0A1I3QXV5_9GAMM|nr:autotransporter domain-containing protein [Xenorhabdus mauleonii]PHM38704.1 outer membrane esterase [Xenorhabdus mauleonii]SFJ38111.1 outer membrane lipase/esterase [Xenorhabdus mauleonii]